MTTKYVRGQGYSARIVLDSINPVGCRLTTWELRYPRFVHSELMTHRLFSRNSSSSRAIPSERLIAQVMNDPALPVWWGKNQSGMQAREELSLDAIEVTMAAWLRGRDETVALARRLMATGLHKQIANRVLEPWMFITVLVSATDYAQWFAQRDHPDAQPEIAWVARIMHDLYRVHEPTPLAPGEWHLPLVTGVDRDRLPDDINVLRMLSVGRCARVSYLTHDGQRDLTADMSLHDRLASATPGHWSPFEHVAMCLPTNAASGNFQGWRQYRKWFTHEHVGGPRP